MTVVSSALFFGVMGAVIGMTIGLLVPQYYESFFPALVGAGSEPWKMGAVLGLTQGLVAGVVVGCVVLLATAWYKSRMSNSLANMVAEAQALQATSPEVDLQEDVDLRKLTKSKGGEPSDS